jgi:hypothetical protein
MGVCSSKSKPKNLSLSHNLPLPNHQELFGLEQQLEKMIKKYKEVLTTKDVAELEKVLMKMRMKNMDINGLKPTEETERNLDELNNIFVDKNGIERQCEDTKHGEQNVDCAEKEKKKKKRMMGLDEILMFASLFLN